MISETVSILQMPWVFEIQGVVYTHRASQFGPATCQLLHSPTRFVATVLDHRGLEGFLKQMGVDGARQHWTGLFWRVWDPAGPHLTLNRLAVTKLFLPLGRLLHASFQVHRMPGTIQHQGKERGKMALQYWGPPGVLQDEKPGSPQSSSITLVSGAPAPLSTLSEASSVLYSREKLQDAQYFRLDILPAWAPHTFWTASLPRWKTVKEDKNSPEEKDCFSWPSLQSPRFISDVNNSSLLKHRC